MKEGPLLSAMYNLQKILIKQIGTYRDETTKGCPAQYSLLFKLSNIVIRDTCQVMGIIYGSRSQKL